MTTAVAIQGGAADGRFAGEVLAQLVETRNFKYDALYGVSVGSIVAALASRLGPRAGMNLWDNEITGFFSIFEPRVFDESGLFNMNPLGTKLQKALEGKMAAVPYSAGMVDWDYGEYHTVWCQDLPRHVDAVIASSSIPILAKPYPNNGIIPENSITEFMDGGAFHNTPLRQAVLDGHDNILVICCQPLTPGLPKFAPINLPVIPEIQLIQRAVRALQTLMHAALLEDFAWADAKQAKKVSRIAPSMSWNVIDFGGATNQMRIAEAKEEVSLWSGF